MGKIEPRSLRIRGHARGRSILCLAGFGDDSTMFDPLLSTDLAATCRIVTVDLPGFGEESPVEGCHRAGRVYQGRALQSVPPRRGG